MRYRLGRHRRRNLYAQHGDEPSDDDVFVALFDDEHMAKTVCRMLNFREETGMAFADAKRRTPTQELTDSLVKSVVSREEAFLAGTATHINRADFGHGPFIPDPVEEENRIRQEAARGPLTPNDECTCDHPAWMHSGHTGYCADANPSDTCVRFERKGATQRCEWSKERGGEPTCSAQAVARYRWGPRQEFIGLYCAKHADRVRLLGGQEVR